MQERVLKPIYWVASSRKDLRAMPSDVQDAFGFALHQAQEGLRHEHAKPLKGFGSAAVLEIVETSIGGTYRAVYTLKFAHAIYVLHCFQKKSARGIATPKPEIDLIRARLLLAQCHAFGGSHD